MSEENSNFHQLLKLRAHENPEIVEWLRKRDEKYTLPEIQNDLQEAVALGMMRQISTNMHNATKQQMFLTRNNYLLAFGGLTSLL